MQTFICMDLFLLNDVIVFHQRASGGRGGESEGVGEGLGILTSILTPATVTATVHSP